MTKEEQLKISEEIENLNQFDKMFLIELILNLERNNHNLTEEINSLRNGNSVKNRDKYMKEIYAMIPSKELVNIIGVDKETNIPFQCDNHVHGDCEKCLFNRNDKCDVNRIMTWLKWEN